MFHVQTSFWRATCDRQEYKLRSSRPYCPVLPSFKASPIALPSLSLPWPRPHGHHLHSSQTPKSSVTYTSLMLVTTLQIQTGLPAPIEIICFGLIALPPRGFLMPVTISVNGITVHQERKLTFMHRSLANGMPHPVVTSSPLFLALPTAFPAKN